MDVKDPEIVMFPKSLNYARPLTNSKYDIEDAFCNFRNDLWLIFMVFIIDKEMKDIDNDKIAGYLKTEPRIAKRLNHSLPCPLTGDDVDTLKDIASRQETGFGPKWMDVWKNSTADYKEKVRSCVENGTGENPGEEDQRVIDELEKIAALTVDQLSETADLY